MIYFHRQDAINYLFINRYDNIDIDDKIIEQRLESLKFILDKNLLDELGLKTDINQKIAQLEAKKTEVIFLDNILINKIIIIF